MAVEFFIPKLGQTVEEVTIVNWLVEDGAKVEQGQPVLEVETDKTVFPVEATAGGDVHRGAFPEGGILAKGWPAGWPPRSRAGRSIDHLAARQEAGNREESRFKPADPHRRKWGQDRGARCPGLPEPTPQGQPIGAQGRRRSAGRP